MDELIKRLRTECTLPYETLRLMRDAADAIEELQATLCNWCAVCPEDKRDLSTCEIYECCRAKPLKEET